MAKKAIVVGGSGLIGRKLLDILYNYPEYDEIVSLSRKKINIHNKKLTQVVIDFDHLDRFAQYINGDVVFCCLGTTKHKTPDRNEYRKIDHDYPLRVAEIAHKNDVEQYHYVSSMGANKKASSFYLKTKGDTEAAIEKIGLPSLYIYRPSLLTGTRNDRRLIEDLAIIIMKIIDPLLIGSLKKYRSIKGYTVALAMFKQSLKNKPGVFIHTSDNIKTLA